VSDKIVISPVTELITVVKRDSKVVVSAPGTPGPAGPAGTTDYNQLTNKPDLSQYATQTYVATAIGNIVDGAPGVLDTLNELAAAINDDSSFASTITTSLGNKQDKVSGVSDTEIGYLDGVTSGIQPQIDSKQASLTATDGIKILSSAYIYHTGVYPQGHKYSDGTLILNGAVLTGDMYITDDNGNQGGTVAQWISWIGGGAYAGTFVATNNIITSDKTILQARVSNVSDTEIGYLNGVTSAIQTQLDSKLDSADLSGYATETYVDNAVSNVTVDLSTAAGSGIDWNTTTSAFDIDSTIATKTYADTAAANAAAAIVDSAPGTLDTLNELAAALGDDSNYATTISTALGLKAPSNSPTFTGTVDFSAATVTGLTIPQATGWNYIGAVSSTSGNAVSFSGLNGEYKELFLTFNEVTTSTQNSLNFFRINNDSTGSNYNCSANRDFGGNTYMGNAISAIYGCIGTMIAFGSYSSGTLTVTNGTSTAFKGLSLNFKGRYSDWITSNYVPDITESIGGAYLGTSAVSSISVTLASGNFTSGTWKLWGLK
jgi:hypothetical protein